MTFKFFCVSKIKVIMSLLFVIGSQVYAEEIIIQDEKMSFQKCLEVVEVSADKLSITPDFQGLGNKTRTAVFTLSDGELKITCDGKKDRILVITKSD